MALRAAGRKNPNRGIRERVATTEPKGPLKQKKLAGPFLGTLQAGPARPVRAHGLSDEHQDRGLLYAERGIFEDAIAEFKKAVEFTPDFSEGWNNMGVCHLYLNHLKEASQCLVEAVKHYPGWAVALANLGLVHHRAKNHEKAITYYRQSVSKNKNQPQVWESLGEALETAGQQQEAQEAYQMAVQLAPKYDLALYRLGMLLARKTELDQAESYLRRSLEIDPNLADACGVLGAIYARRGDMDTARQYFERAQSISPDKVPSTAARGLAALNTFTAKVAENLKELEGAYEDLPSIAECMFNAGLAYMQSQNYGMARSSFEAAHQDDTQWPEPLIWLGMVNALEGQPAVARENWEAARSLQPDNALLPECIGLSCLALGLNKEAEKNFEAARGQGREIEA